MDIGAAATSTENVSISVTGKEFFASGNMDRSFQEVIFIQVLESSRTTGRMMLDALLLVERSRRIVVEDVALLAFFPGGWPKSKERFAFKRKRLRWDL
jgi:hypothetical protein